MIINLIANPRNLSTAFMYSMAQRQDTYVIDEPFYACYLKKSGKQHPGRSKILNHYSTDRNEVLAEISELSNKYEIVFLKNMAHHMEYADVQLDTGWNHCFLIRHPALMIQSFSKIIEEPELEDLGVTIQKPLYEKLVLQGEKPFIINANELLKNPERQLKAFCSHFKIEFDANMLKWDKGKKSYDGIWEEFWYQGVHQSKQFGKAREIPENNLNGPLLSLYNQTIKDFNYLNTKSLKE